MCTSCNQTITITIIHPAIRQSDLWNQSKAGHEIFDILDIFDIIIVKSPEEDLTGEKTITASLKVSIVFYESYEKESLDGLRPNILPNTNQKSVTYKRNQGRT